MPGMDGFETAELIRQRQRSETTPIIFISAVNDTETHVSRGYWGKPEATATHRR